MAPPSMIDFVLSRKLADGIAIVGCSERSCFNRLGVDWTEQRFAHERDPYLRTRVPRDRLTTIWASSTQTSSLAGQLDEFRSRLPPASLQTAEMAK